MDASQTRRTPAVIFIFEQGRFRTLPLELLMGCEAVVLNLSVTRRATPMGLRVQRSKGNANSTTQHYLQPAAGLFADLAGLHFCAPV